MGGGKQQAEATGRREVVHEVAREPAGLFDLFAAPSDSGPKTVRSGKNVGCNSRLRGICECHGVSPHQEVSKARRSARTKSVGCSMAGSSAASSTMWRGQP